jgi:S-adenosylmethionine synthetase
VVCARSGSGYEGEQQQGWQEAATGDPDTICNALADTLSRNFCRYYLVRFGKILRHNVDKFLLRGGASVPALGCGAVVAPVEIYLCGRVISEAAGVTVPLDEMIAGVSRRWRQDKLRAVDADRHVRLHNLVRPGSLALQRAVRPRRGCRRPAVDQRYLIGRVYTPASVPERWCPAFTPGWPAGAACRITATRSEDSKIMAYTAVRRSLLPSGP